MKKFFLILLLFVFTFSYANAADYHSREIKYQYGVLKQDLEKERDGKILNRFPSGYMTVEEYEKASQYKDKSKTEFSIPKIENRDEYKYIPVPVYSIVKYNNPPGGTELSLGKKLFALTQINAQGVVSPSYDKLVYPAIYYYGDSATVDSDLFVIPLEGNDNVLNKILKANVAKRDPNPILSTDKNIDNYAAFRTLTPVDFSADGRYLLAKEKIGSSEDGIWETRIYTYDFQNKLSYDLNDIREAISYFWKQYVKLNLDLKRWDIKPLGFLKDSPDRVAVQAYAYTGDVPVYLGAWSISAKGEGTQLITFDKDAVPAVGSYGYKLIKDGVESYTTVMREEKYLKHQAKVLKKQVKQKDKEFVNSIKDEYKYKIKDLTADYKDEYRDNKKLQSFKGSTTGTEIQEAYKKYLEDQLQKDIDKTKKKIEKQQKQLDKLDNLLQKTGDSAKELYENVYGVNNYSESSEQQDDTSSESSETNTQ